MSNKHILFLSIFIFISACGSGKQDANDTVTISNEPPIAIITADKLSVFEGERINFTASNSSDPEGENLTYQWKIVIGEEIAIHNSDSYAYFTPEVSTDDIIYISLTVTDNNNNTDISKLSIDIKNLEVDSTTISLLNKCLNPQEEDLTLDSYTGSSMTRASSIRCELDNSTNLTEDELNSITKFPFLSYLGFVNNDPNNLIYIDTLTDLSSSKSLSTLSLKNVNVIDNSIGLIKNLNILSLTGGKVTTNLNDLPNLTNLEIDNALVGPIDSIQLPESLTNIILRNAISSNFITSIQSLNNLKSLQFYETNHSSSFDFSNLQNLELLVIDSESISSVDLTELNKLAQLYLTRNNFSLFPDITTLNNLRILSIKDNNSIFDNIPLTPNLLDLESITLDTRLLEYPDISQFKKLVRGTFLYFKTMDISPLLNPSQTVLTQIKILTTCKDDVETRSNVPINNSISIDLKFPFASEELEECL